ncbi:hypothetical protein [Candidatus Nitrosocosmicus sp. R]
MQHKQYLSAVVVVIAIVTVGLVAMPSISEQAYAGNSISESKNKGQQGEESSDGKRQGHGGTNCPKCGGSDDGTGV